MSTPIADSIGQHAAAGAHALPEQPPAQPAAVRPQAWMTAVPRWFRVVWRDGQAAVSHMEPVATNKLIDDLIEEGLRAAGAGVAAEVFQAATDALRNAAERKQAAPAGTGAQPAFTPAHAADPQDGA